MNPKTEEINMHEQIMNRMRRISEPGPAAFCRVMAGEPGLLVKYLRSCGIRCSRAELKGQKEDRIVLSVLMEKKEKPVSFVLRFLRPGETILSCQV